MPRGKKKSATESVVAEVATKTAASAKKAGKPRTTKAKAASTTNKTASKTTKKTVKKTETAAPKAKASSPKATAKPTKKTSVDKKSTSTPKRTTRKSTKSTGDQVIIQGKSEYTLAEITEMCKKAYRNGTKKQIKTINVYIKAEKNALKAYYVVNDSIDGSIDL